MACPAKIKLLKLTLPNLTHKFALLRKRVAGNQRWLFIQREAVQAQAISLVDILQLQDNGF